MNEATDRCLRAMTDDGGFRVITVRTTDTVRGVLESQGATGATARWLADLVTGTVLVRETMAPNYRVQGILHGVGRSGTLVADSHPDGGSRGLVQRRGESEPLVAGGAVLEMMRTLPKRGLHRGMVEVPEGGGIAGALMAYMQESEQVLSVVAAGAVFDGDEVRAAGGYLVQILPELSEPVLAVMTERLDDLPPIEGMLRDERTTPDSLLAELLHAMPHTLLADTALAYRCRCDAVRLMATLATLPREEILDMVNEGKALEIQCDYCRREYRIDPEQLRGLLAAS